MASKRIESMSVKERLKASNRKNLVIYVGISALVVITISFFLASFFIPPTVTGFELQINDWHYDPSIGSFIVKGTIGSKVPTKGDYKLRIVSITDGNKTIVLRHYEDGFTYIHFNSVQWRPDMGTDWTFHLWEGIALESKVVQLNFDYEIGHDGLFGYNILETGTEVFSVNVE